MRLVEDVSTNRLMNAMKEMVGSWGLEPQASTVSTRNPHHACPSNANSPGPRDQQQSADVAVGSLSRASTRSLIASVGVYDHVRTSFLSPSVSRIVLPPMTARLIVRPRKQ